MKKLFFVAIAIGLSYFAYTQGCGSNYVPPTFQLDKTNPSCSANSGAISVTNQQDGVQPFTYRLIETNTTNATGVFTGLGVGTYTVELRDACGTIRTRQATLVTYNLSFVFTIDKPSDCNDGKISIVPTPLGLNYQYAVITPSGDTTWSSTPDFDIKLFKTLTILLRDDCGNTVTQSWTAPSGYLGFIAELQHRLQCDKFDIFPVFYGFNKPNVCLYSYPDNKLIECKQGDVGPDVNFYDLPWGNYYVIVQDDCFRDSAFHPDQRSKGGSELNPYDWDCTTFTMHVDGLEDTVCLYDAATNKLISCKGQDTVSLNPHTGLPWPSGAVWENLPYGSYYAWIYDPCTDSTFRIDSTVSYPFETATYSRSMCSLTETQVVVGFGWSTKGPYSVQVYYPNGLLATTWNSTAHDNYIPIPEFPGTGLLTVIASDGCGHSDTSYVEQQPVQIFKTVTVVNKCPGVSGAGGSGEISINSYSNNPAVSIIPKIIRKNGAPVSINFSTSSGSYYSFVDLESGTYVLSYGANFCSQLVVYDTVEVKDYVYPSQPGMQVYQCYINQFTFSDTLVGGLAPFTYQIIGSTPAFPVLTTPAQASSTFTINPGAAYQKIRVRAVDVCGNSTIGDVNILQMVGCEVLALDSAQGHRTIENKLAKVFPNPSNKQFYISFSRKKKSSYRIEITNAAGVMVFETTLLNIDRKDYLVDRVLMPGLYFIHVNEPSTGKSSTFKQIVL